MAADSERLVHYFPVLDLPFESMAENDFQEADRMPFDACRALSGEVLRPPLRLDMDLRCPVCEMEFRHDFYTPAGGRASSRQNQIPDVKFQPNLPSAAIGPIQGADRPLCPGCGLAGRLDGGEVLEIFESRLRAALAAGTGDEAEERRLGRIIALAALLLEPLGQIFVVGFWADRLGHYLYNSQIFRLQARKFSPGPPPLLIAFPPRPEKCSNPYVTELWARDGHYLITPAARFAYDLLRRLPGHTLDHPALNLAIRTWSVAVHRPGHSPLGPDRTTESGPRYDVFRPDFKPRHARHLIDLRELYWAVDPDLSMADAEPPFRFTEDERRRARAWLAERGVGPDYAVFAGRDQAYVAKKASNYNAKIYDHKNMNIRNFIPAALRLAELGLPALRLGSVVAEYLELSVPGLVDYPAGETSPFLDIYLTSHCRFYLGAPSGVAVPVYLAKKPMALVNYSFDSPMFLFHQNPNVHLAFKKLWCPRKKGYLTLREILTRRIDSMNYWETERRLADGLTVEESSPEEILAAAEEMHVRYIVGGWRVTDDEKRNRERFTGLMAEFYPGQAVRLNLIHSFFQKNRFFLEDA